MIKKKESYQLLITEKKALNEGAAEAKGSAYSTNSCHLHNEPCWKANLILQPERLPCINELPSHGKVLHDTQKIKKPGDNRVMSVLHWSAEP